MAYVAGVTGDSAWSDCVQLRNRVFDFRFYSSSDGYVRACTHECSRNCASDAARPPCNCGAFTSQINHNFSRSRSLTTFGFAFPFEALITWPTKKPIKVSLPERYAAT